MNVTWDENTCTHSGQCVQSLPQVFKVENGEFVIDTSAGDKAEISNVVAQCPSGALKIID